MDKNINADIIDLFIMDYIGNEKRKITPIELTSLLKEKFNLKRKELNLRINNLVQNNSLEYSNIFGSTFLEISFSKPVKISDHVVVKPPESVYQKKLSEIVVTIEKGTSFGRGTHPTTRLSIDSIDKILHKQRSSLYDKSALDIGTGSGVLAITGVLFGIGEIDACDIDTVSLNEAKKNSILNNVENKIVYSTSFNNNKHYDFIFANLRFPTLIDLFDQISEMSNKNTYVVFSGIKIEEKEKIIKKYSGDYFKIIGESSEKGWSAIILKKI